MKPKLRWLALLGFLVVACSPRAAVIDAAVYATLTAQAPTSVLPADRPTSTLVPTVLPATTAAPTPTETVAPTDTPDPEASPTQEPTPTEGPTPTETPFALELGELIYEEPFDTVGPWAVGETDTSNVQVADGVMRFTQKNPGTFAFRITGRQADDFYIEVSAQADGLCRSGDKYGLIFRLQDGASYYAFLVDCEKQFRILRVVNGTLEPLNDWTPDSIIDGSTNAANLLGVRGRGNKLDFFVNDEHVYSAEDDRFGGGRFGMWVGAGVTTNFTVLFDDLRIYSLP